ncbi:hypothetical protein RND81_09G072100 [Saponaria officinalis]|uniref:Uncharacterized protein n=1 Tax=Saponaria officinalis TaxID=3572 RepID=A0AAW1IJ44_SAPOF
MDYTRLPEYTHSPNNILSSQISNSHQLPSLPSTPSTPDNSQIVADHPNCRRRHAYPCLLSDPRLLPTTLRSSPTPLLRHSSPTTLTARLRHSLPDILTPRRQPSLLAERSLLAGSLSLSPRQSSANSHSLPDYSHRTRDAGATYPHNSHLSRRNSRLILLIGYHNYIFRQYRTIGNKSRIRRRRGRSRRGVQLQKRVVRVHGRTNYRKE